MSLKVLFVSAEGAPFAKVGGLADVVGALPKALRKLGIDARVVLPGYCLVKQNPKWTLSRALKDIEVTMNTDWSENVGFLETEIDGVPFGFIESKTYFDACDSSATLYGPGYERHLLFCAGVMRTMEALDWIPDVIHCHDWHTGFLPVLLSEARGPLPHSRRDWGKGQPERWAESKSIFTIHNLAYQGEWGTEVLDALGLNHDLFTWDKLETWGRVNFLKSGMVGSDFVNTVSPNYAKEIQTPEFGCTLEGVMSHLNATGRLAGILNGIDTTVFDPATDEHIAQTFWPEHMEGKAVCRKTLRAEFGLPDHESVPVVGMVGRLSDQKGFDLLMSALPDLMALDVQLVVLGSGDPRVAEGLRHAQVSHPDQIRMIEKFDEALAQRIYAGSDLFLMPSHFEPCGLGQLIAMRYGTLPIVRATGGLKDTVHHQRNGFVFTERSPNALVSVVREALAAWNDLGERGSMIQTAMTGEYGWDASANEYARIYEKVGDPMHHLSPAKRRSL